MKKLAMLLALCLIVTALPVAAFAEDGAVEELQAAEFVEVIEESEDAEEMVSEAVIGEEGPATEEAIEEPLPDVGAEDMPELEESQEAQEAQEPQDAPEEEQVTANALAEAALAEGPEEDAAEQSDAAEEGELQSNAPHVDPDGPVLASNEITLGAGETFALKPTLPAGKTGEIVLASSDPAVATVSANGTVTAVAPGDACITAAAIDSTYSECIVHVKKAPDKVAFSVKSLNIGKGESTDALKVVIGSAEGEYAGSYTFSSSKPKYVKVTSDGTVKGVKEGKSATITVKTYNGKTATCKVSVLKAPKKITVSADKKSLGLGETGRITYTLPKKTASQATFTSDDPAVVAVDAKTGEITGVGIGKTRVCAKTFNGKKGYVTITVGAAPESVSFKTEKIRLGVGMKLTAAASLNAGAAGGITYTIQNSAIASCSGTTLKGLSKGETVLTATTYNGKTAQCAVVVTAAPSYVKLPYSTLNVVAKQSVKLEPDVGDSASTYTFSSDNKKYVKVSADGTVTGVKKGSATITIKTYNNKKVKLKVNVVKAASSVSVSPTKLELGIGETGKLKPSFPKGTSAIVTYSSGDTSVAVVDAKTGVVTGVAPGSAVITATTHNGKKATATVEVFTAPEWVDLSESFIEIAETQTYKLNVKLSPGSRSPLKFSSQNTAVASVSGDGVITGTGGGSTVVTVETNVPGVTASLNVTVLPAPKSVTLDKTSLTLNVGETTQMVPTIEAGTVTEFTFTSSNEDVATVSEEGNVVAVSKGKVTLTVTTHNGKKATLALTVEDPWFPEELKLTNAPDFMKAGKSIQLQWTAKPETAVADFVFSSSDESVATVDSDGLLKGVSYGYAKITAKSKRNPNITLTFTVGVETDHVTLEIPARTTSVSGISANLAKIDAIRVSAIEQINLLQSGGVISSSDAAKREKIVNNAFKDYAFPWMTLKKQKYWKAANSEGGAKDFKTNRVYYGIPYISGSGSNREYNAAKAVKEKRFYDSGKGYYVLNQKKLLKSKYCGNDCSCFVDAAIWGTNSGHSDDRTKEIAKSSAYKTVGNYKNLRTGDLICKGGSHVVMFLYYINADKTKMMIIENGGIEAGTNTVHCMVMKTSWYTGRGYKVRRLKSLG